MRAKYMLVQASVLFLCCTSAVSSALAADQAAIDACIRAVKAQEVPSVEYKPGVDVHGRKVAPANLGNNYNIKPPKVIEFPIKYDAAKNLGFNGSGLYEGQATVATVRIEGNKVTINGQEVNTQSTADLIAACRKSRK